MSSLGCKWRGVKSSNVAETHCGALRRVAFVDEFHYGNVHFTTAFDLSSLNGHLNGLETKRGVITHIPYLSCS